MNRKSNIMVAWLVMGALGGSNALGSARMFLIPKGMNPASHAAGTDVTITRLAGQQFTVEIWERATSGQQVGAFQWVLPCSAGGTASASLSRVGNPASLTWDSHADYIFAEQPDFAIVNPSCTPTIAGGAALGAGCVTPGTGAKYLGEVVFETGYETGVINLQLLNPGPGTLMNDCAGASITLTDLDGLIVNVIPRKNADIAPCGGNGLVDLDDILAVLQAFGGNHDCPGVGRSPCCIGHASGSAPHDQTTGCLDQAIARCVCAVNPFCCENEWDDNCAGQVEALGCGYCP